MRLSGWPGTGFSTRSCAVWEVLELDATGRYLHVLGASTGTLEKIPWCAGLTLDLDALWAAIDNLE